VLRLALAAATSVAALVTLPAGAHPEPAGIQATRMLRAGAATSTNWAGYVVADPEGSTTSTTFTSITGTWKQPKAVCARGQDAFSATWVGLGGFSRTSRALEQIGTSADCRETGKATYYAWYELVPAPMVRIGLEIAPGDTITTSVNASEQGVLVQIKDRTRHTSFTREVAATALDLTSADWIEEAPSTCLSFTQCRVLPLANFRSVTMSRIATIGSSHPGTITDPAWEATAVQLVPDSSSSSTAGATPGAVSGDGRSFQVVYQTNAGSQ
jgi:hypothetical protein